MKIAAAILGEFTARLNGCDVLGKCIIYLSSGLIRKHTGVSEQLNVSLHRITRTVVTRSRTHRSAHAGRRFIHAAIELHHMHFNYAITITHRHCAVYSRQSVSSSLDDFSPFVYFSYSSPSSLCLVRHICHTSIFLMLCERSAAISTNFGSKTRHSPTQVDTHKANLEHPVRSLLNRSSHCNGIYQYTSLQARMAE